MKGLSANLIQISLLVLIICTASNVLADERSVDFQSDSWLVEDGEVEEFLGRQSFRGTGYLDGVTFANGIIEVEMAVNGQRSYPGIKFRIESPGNMEKIYVRPHRAGLYADAVQYAPEINGVSEWQFYNGEGFTAAVDLSENEWIPVRLEFLGNRARVFIGDLSTPVLQIDDLQRDPVAGAIGLFNQNDSTAHFSNLRYTITDEIAFEPFQPYVLPLGMIRDWELSNAFSLAQVNLEKSSEEHNFDEITWHDVQSNEHGLVDVALYVENAGASPKAVFARTTIHAEQDTIISYAFGYSDAITVFLNGRILFFGNSSYRYRDPSFLGILGLFDMLFLPLEEGDNILEIIVAESFGGWGFMFQDAHAQFVDESLHEEWTIENTLKYPEAVIYDPRNEVLYVSNYFNGGAECISRVSLTGEVLDFNWVEGVNRPTGMCISGWNLYVVERGGVVGIDTRSGEILQRYPIEGVGFINDITVDHYGRLYVTDSQTSAIYRIVDDTAEVWLQNDAIGLPNGILADGEYVYIGCTTTSSIERVHQETMEIERIVQVEREVNIDGLYTDGNGGFYFSQAQGRFIEYNSNTGERRDLINTIAASIYCADFAFIPEQNLLIVPTLYGQTLTAYRVER